MGHTACVSQSGELYVWGTNKEGCLGVAVSGCHQPMQVQHFWEEWSCCRSPRPSACAPRYNQCTRLCNVEETAQLQEIDPRPLISFVACGWRHTACITADQVLFTWGSPRSKLGRGCDSNKPVPVQTFHMQDQASHGHAKPMQAPQRMSVPKIVLVALGDDTTLCVDTSGLLYGCGTYCGTWAAPCFCPKSHHHMSTAAGHRECMCALPLYTSGQRPGQEDTAVSVSCGARHSVIQGASGRVYTFGVGGDGRLGLGRPLAGYADICIPTDLGVLR